jgi:hypothetical protein
MEFARLHEVATGLREGFLRVGAQRHYLFLAQHPVLPASQLGAVRLDQQEQPLDVAQFDGLAAGLRLFDLGVGEWHGRLRFEQVGSDTPNCADPHPRKYPLLLSAGNAPYRTTRNKKAP